MPTLPHLYPFLSLPTPAPTATPIATAAGIDDAQQPFGTDPLEIVEAIRSVWSADGVLVLMDLGSAVMSATVAMDLLEPGQAAVVQLVAAPFVEGAMAAAVQASIGNRLDEVAAAASGALGAKQSALGEITSATPPVDAAPAELRSMQFKWARCRGEALGAG